MGLPAYDNGYVVGNRSDIAIVMFYYFIPV